MQNRPFHPRLCLLSITVVAGLTAVALPAAAALVAAAGAPVGMVSNYTDASISFPTKIAAGPDGALWFTNQSNNSIGRITTSGVVSNYTDASISSYGGIAAGPDGALWFTNQSNSIGRISCSPRLIRERSSPACSRHQ